MSNSLLKDIDRLTALDQMTLVKDHSRDSVDALI
jgi:hypothetical protein